MITKNPPAQERAYVNVNPRRAMTVKARLPVPGYMAREGGGGRGRGRGGEGGGGVEREREMEKREGAETGEGEKGGGAERERER
jgi:hypothetical protein